MLVILDASEPDSLNPHIGSSAPTANLSEMTMAWLFNSDLKGYSPNSVTPFDNMLDVDI